MPLLLVVELLRTFVAGSGRCYNNTKPDKTLKESLLHFEILTLFPGMFQGPFDYSIVKRAIDAGLITLNIRDIRDYSTDKHRTVDDYPYGGGAGMVMKPEPIFRAVEAALAEMPQIEVPEEKRALVPPHPREDVPAGTSVILLTPQGRLLRQNIVAELAGLSRLVLICGRYEGVDERVRPHLVTDEISIGDFVLSGGELPAMVLVDAVARLIPGVVEVASLAEESYTSGLLEYPQYTRPAEFRGHKVPEILLSGHHGQVAKWRRKEALRRTLQRRPELLATAPLSSEDQKLLEEIRREEASSSR